MKNIKIFEHGTVKEVLQRMLKQGYIPLNSKEAYAWKKKSKYPEWIDTRTIFDKGKFRNATLKELKNIEDTYKNIGRLVCLNLDYGGFYGLDYINYGGRFLGVKQQSRSKSKSDRR